MHAGHQMHELLVSSLSALQREKELLTQTVSQSEEDLTVKADEIHWLRVCVNAAEKERQEFQVSQQIHEQVRKFRV
jgi:hypothetical protein